MHKLTKLIFWGMVITNIILNCYFIKMFFGGITVVVRSNGIPI